MIAELGISRPRAKMNLAFSVAVPKMLLRIFVLFIFKEGATQEPQTYNGLPSTKQAVKAIAR